MTLDELSKVCDEAEAQVDSELAHIIVNVPRRRRFNRRYRVCKGLSGDVIGCTDGAHWTVAIKCSKVRDFLSQFQEVR